MRSWLIVSSTSKSASRVAQIDEREAVEVEAVGDVETERLAVEVDRARLVEHADHHVDRFAAIAALTRRKSLDAGQVARVVYGYYRQWCYAAMTGRKSRAASQLSLASFSGRPRTSET